jgi:hypothetical protein
MQLGFNSNSIEEKWMQNGGQDIENMFMNMVFNFGTTFGATSESTLEGGQDCYHIILLHVIKPLKPI